MTDTLKDDPIVSKNVMMEAEDIGMLLYENGWSVHKLINDCVGYRLGYSQESLMVAGHKKIGEDEFHVSIIGGTNNLNSLPREPSEAFEVVEMRITMGKKRDFRCVFKDELNEALKNPYEKLSVPWTPEEEVR